MSDPAAEGTVLWSQSRHEAVLRLRGLAERPVASSAQAEIQRDLRTLLDLVECDLDACSALLRKWSAENLRLKEALMNIGAKARWYAENDSRDPQEVDHALCVEVLDLAENALDTERNA